MISTKTMYRITCDHVGCTQIMGGDEHEFWTWESLVPVAEANDWILELPSTRLLGQAPGVSLAYCYDHAPREGDDD